MARRKVASKIKRMQVSLMIRIDLQYNGNFYIFRLSEDIAVSELKTQLASVFAANLPAFQVGVKLDSGRTLNETYGN